MAELSVTENWPGEFREIYRELRRFNVERNPGYFAAVEDPARKERGLYVAARDERGQLIGGLTAETRFAWLKVSIMTVLEPMRRRGVGRAMLLAAEAEAFARGCRHSFVDTMDYQAPGFYEKCGYRVAGKLEDWDSHGHTKFFLVKELAQGWWRE
jgi:GNAT superfamily N-acetyltransferase